MPSVRFRIRIRTLMIATAALTVIVAIPIEMRKKAWGKFAAFHAAGARELREVMHTSEVTAIECERRAALGVPSETKKGLIYDDPPRMLAPDEWAHWARVFRGNVELFRMMAEQREGTGRGYWRAINRPWESPPSDSFRKQIEALDP
jgi:hypothetical protein